MMFNPQLIIIGFTLIMVIIILWLVYLLYRQNIDREAAQNRLNGIDTGNTVNIETTGRLDAEHLTEAYDNGYIQCATDFLTQLIADYNSNHTYVVAEILRINKLQKISVIGQFGRNTLGKLTFKRSAQLG